MCSSHGFGQRNPTVVTTIPQTRLPPVYHPLLTLYIKGCYLFLFFYSLLGAHCTGPYLCGWYLPAVTLRSTVLLTLWEWRSL